MRHVSRDAASDAEAEVQLGPGRVLRVYRLADAARLSLRVSRGRARPVTAEGVAAARDRLRRAYAQPPWRCAAGGDDAPLLVVACGATRTLVDGRLRWLAMRQLAGVAGDAQEALVRDGSRVAVLTVDVDGVADGGPGSRARMRELLALVDARHPADAAVAAPAAPPRPPDRALPVAVRRAVWNAAFGAGAGAGACACCGAAVTQQDYECGHVVPRAMGGSDALGNLRVVCRGCNRSMGTRHMDEFRAAHFGPDADAYACADADVTDAMDVG